MAGRLRRFPEYGVTLIVFSGIVKDDETAELLRELNNTDRCRLLYFSEGAEVGGVIADASRIKKVLGKKLTALSESRSAWVFRSASAKEFLVFLKRYLATGDMPVTISRRMFSSLETACEWLGLADGACGALAEEVNRASPEERRGRESAGPEPGGSPDQASH